MSSRDRDLKSLQDKLKVFLKKGSSGELILWTNVIWETSKALKSVVGECLRYRCVAAALPARSELVVSAELARELCRDAPPPRRLRAMKDLADRVHTLRVSEVPRLYSCTLITHSNHLLLLTLYRNLLQRKPSRASQ